MPALAAAGFSHVIAPFACPATRVLRRVYRTEDRQHDDRRRKVPPRRRLYTGRRRRARRPSIVLPSSRRRCAGRRLAGRVRSLAARGRRGTARSRCSATAATAPRSLPGMAEQLKRGYAAVATDTGHKGDDPDFAADRPEAIVDWASRAVHVSIDAAKSVVSALYDQAARHAYFWGCSTGGQQALMEAQRYPKDFDEIIAGDPGNNRTHLNAGFLWQFVKNHRAPTSASSFRRRSWPSSPTRSSRSAGARTAAQRATSSSPTPRPAASSRSNCCARARTLRIA